MTEGEKIDSYNYWIQNQLQKLGFVDWDRFTEFKDENGQRVTRVFGWIDRPDSHEDFVQLEFQETGRNILFLGTSSKKYSQKIADILGTGHTECNRVEDRFENLENKIELQS